MAGVDLTGFSIKTLTEVLAEIRVAQQNRIDPALDFSTEKALGQLNGLVSEREALLWELLRVAFGAFDPDQAEGYLLEALSALTGTVRRAASPTLVAGSVNLDAGTTLPLGSRAAVAGSPTKTFKTQAAVGPVPTSGWYPVTFECEVTGPVAAPAGTLTVIAGPVSGWNAVTNATDGALGRVTDSDAVLRQRRAEDLSRSGSSTPDAIRSDLLAISGIQKVTVFENLSDYTNEDAMPPHSIEVLIYDGAVPSVSNTVIAQAIWNAKAPVRTFGNTSGVAVDSEGTQRTVFFSRPVEKAVWITANVDVEGVVPGDAVTLLKAALVTLGNLSLTPSADVIALALRAILYDTRTTHGYTWVNDVPELLLGFSNPPVLGNNLIISPREVARLDTSRVAITLT